LCVVEEREREKREKIKEEFLSNVVVEMR